MKKLLVAVSALVSLFSCGEKEVAEAPVPPFLKSESKNTTPTYERGIAFWQEMADFYPEINLHQYGITDAGLPLHVVVIDGERPRPIGAYKTSMKQVLLVNNAIHPGEPDGVDASMLMAHELMTNDRSKRLLKDVSLVIIPFYNIGGALNRNSYSRTNQNGPEEYGFRGNAQNLDLNRDFIKCDSRNAKTFATLVNELDPDLYVETHVSNGADYQYVITYICSQEDKIGKRFTDKMRKEWTPYIESKVGKAGFKICPYVNVHGEAPDKGFPTFYDQPRYSTGFLALRGTPGYITETHMLKPYKQRVNATYEFLMGGLSLLSEKQVRRVIDEQRKEFRTQDTFVLDWEVDTSNAVALQFDGYEAGYKESEVTGEQRLYYDRTKPFSTKIPYYPYLKPTVEVKAPEYYILRRGFVEVEDRLRANGITLEEFGVDTTLEMEVYHITDFKTSDKPYEKHYYHYNTNVSASVRKVRVSARDWIIRLDNNHRRFLIEVLEPKAPDSYFNWNFFDAVLQQKEWYSAYVFEDEAARLLSENDSLRAEFERAKDIPVYSNNPVAQLYWVYQHSKRYEKEHMLYPVYRGIN